MADLFPLIHNALRSLALAGKFPEVTLAKDGSIVLGEELSPDSVSIASVRSTFRAAENFRRSIASDRHEWVWSMRMSFPSQVSFERWEKTLTDSDIAIGTVDGRQILARLVSAEYNPPPEASPNRGSSAEFTFEIHPFLRK